jgi:hypothetical protein
MAPEDNGTQPTVFLIAKTLGSIDLTALKASANVATATATSRLSKGRGAQSQKEGQCNARGAREHSG